MSDVESNDSEQLPSAKMPPRAQSAYHPARRRAAGPGLPPSGDSGSSLESGGTRRRSLRPNQSFSSAPGGGVPVRRRASFAALPNTNKPALRRGMSVVPSNVLSGQNARRSSMGQRTAEERAFADEIRAQKLAKKTSSLYSSEGGNADGEDAAPRGEVCGMCGNCGEGDKAMPPWAPERLAKLSQEQRSIVLLDVRAKEEGGKLARELRQRQLELAQMSANGSTTTNGTRSNSASVASSIDSGFAPPKRRPALKRQSTRLSAVLAPGNNSDARRARAVARAAKISQMDTVDNNNAVTPALAGHSNNNSNSNNALSDDDDDIALNLGAVKIVSMESGKSELDELGAVSSTTSSGTAGGEQHSDCDECDLLETRLKDLEEQLGVLRNVVKASSPTNPRSSSLDEKKQAAWHERVLGTFAGAPPGSETYKLKEEVTALRKATNTLFSKLQDADAKRAGNHPSTNTQTAVPTANHI